MGALCVSSIALRPRTIWNAAGIGTPAGQLERAKRIILVLNATISPLWGVGGGIGVLKNFNFWGERKPKSPQLLQSSRSCDLSAEREVDADNRSCSASRDFLCVRVLVV